MTQRLAAGKPGVIDSRVPARDTLRDKRGFRVRQAMRDHLGLLLVGFVTFVLMGAGQSLYGPALPAFAREHGIGPGAAGLVVSAHWVGCFAGVAVMYLRGARIGPRAVLAGMALGAALIAAGLGWAATLAGALVFGMGYGGSTVVFNPRVLRAFGARGPGMMSLLNASFGIGAIAAPLVFVALGTNPALTFGLVAGLVALVWLGAGRAGDAAAPARAAGPFRPDWVILGFGAVAIGLEACLIGLGPAALIAAGQTEIAAARLLSVFFAAFLGVRVVLIFTAHLLGSFTLFTAAMVGACGMALAAALVSPAVFFVGLGGCAGLFFQGYYVTAQARMGDDPRVAPTIIAAGLVGGIVSPLLLTGVLGTLGERGFFWVIAGVTGMVAVAALALRRRMAA